MTAITRQRWIKTIIGLIALPLATWGATAVRTSLVWHSQYDVDMARLDGKLDRILDVACDGKLVRACSVAPPAPMQAGAPR